MAWTAEKVEIVDCVGTSGMQRDDVVDFEHRARVLAVGAAMVLTV